jgi:hypothetical protein
MFLFVFVMLCIPQSQRNRERTWTCFEKKKGASEFFLAVKFACIYREGGGGKKARPRTQDSKLKVFFPTRQVEFSGGGAKFQKPNAVVAERPSPVAVASLGKIARKGGKRRVGRWRRRRREETDGGRDWGR